MGKKDSAVKNLFRNKRRYADLFNGVCFGGAEVIKPEELVEINGESDFMFQDASGKYKYVQRYRDIAKGWNGIILQAVLATEYQDMVHYAMPIKNMIMDALSYTDQMKDRWADIPEAEKKALIGKPDYFSRFRKEDKLHPVITLVFYNGDDWDGNIDLYDMFDLSKVKDERIKDALKKYVPNYHINLFNPIGTRDFSVFKTDLQNIFGVLQYRGDMEQICKYVNGNTEFFKSMDYDSCIAVKELLDTKLIFKEEAEIKEEGNDMCKALDDLYNKGRSEGRELGRSEGRELGLTEGQELSVINLITKGKLTLEDGAEELGISVERLREKLA